MTYTVTKLITNAWYLSGIVARNLQTITSDQLSDGLDLLNAFLAVETADRRMIPYYQIYNFTAVAGQEMYFIPNLIEVDSFTFFIGSVRYSMFYRNRKPYFGEPRIQNIESLPYSWHIERCFGGANLYVYFLPNTNYAMQISAKFSLNSVALGQDLSTTLDLFYIEYLRYALANKMCEEYNIEFQPQSLMKLRSYQSLIKDISPLDLSMVKMSSLSTNNKGDIYLEANLQLGWTTS